MNKIFVKTNSFIVCDTCIVQRGKSFLIVTKKPFSKDIFPLYFCKDIFPLCRISLPASPMVLILIYGVCWDEVKLGSTDLAFAKRFFCQRLIKE